MNIKILSFSLALLMSGYAMAQDKLNLSLVQAQEYALEHNRALQNASLDIKKAEASRWQTLASMLPQANVTLDYQNFCGYEMLFEIAEGMGTTIAMNPTGNLTAQVAMAVSGAQVVGAQIGRIAINMAQITQQKTQKQIIDQVTTLYFSALAMEETVKLLDKNLANIEQLFKLTQNSVKVGVTEQTDADKLSVQIASMKNTINSAKRSLEMVYNSLRLQIGTGVNSEIVLTQTIDELLNIETAMELLTTEFNIEGNYNYQLLDKSNELSKKQVTLAAWNYGPTLSAFYSYTNKTYFGKSEGFNMTPPNLVGASLKIPIFSSGVNYRKLTEAKISQQIQQNNFDDTRDGLLIQHSQLQYNLKSAFESYETQKQNIAVSQSVFDNISRKYEQGLSSSLEVTNAGTSLISAQSSYVQALIELVNSQIALGQLLNKNTH